MKNVLIGLLIVAAGTGVFFLVRSKKDNTKATAFNKEFIIGKWKTVSVEPVKDSAQALYQYDFQKDGITFRSVNDTVKADTARYEWNKANELVIKENVSDTIGKVYAVVKLTADTLQVRSVSDSVNMLLTKAK